MKNPLLSIAVLASTLLFIDARIEAQATSGCSTHGTTPVGPYVTYCSEVLGAEAEFLYSISSPVECSAGFSNCFFRVDTGASGIPCYGGVGIAAFCPESVPSPPATFCGSLQYAHYDYQFSDCEGLGGEPGVHGFAYASVFLFNCNCPWWEVEGEWRSFFFYGSSCPPEVMCEYYLYRGLFRCKTSYCDA